MSPVLRTIRPQYHLEGSVDGERYVARFRTRPGSDGLRVGRL